MKMKNLLKEYSSIRVMVPKKHRNYTLRELPKEYWNDIIITNELSPKDSNYQERAIKQIKFANKNNLDFRGTPKDNFKEIFGNTKFKKQEF